MCRIGIDFSINNPGATVRTDKGIQFYNFPRQGALKEDFAVSLRDSQVNLVNLAASTGIPKTASIALRERTSLIDSVMVTRTVINELITASQDYPGPNISVAIEGFSFGSSGNRLSQLSGYQWLLRYMLIEELGVLPHNFHVFSPMTVKATAGKGNLKKDGMIQSFIETEDTQLRETQFWNNMITDAPSFQTKRGGWLKVDDIVDSYWVLRTLEKHVEPFSIT